MTRYQARDLCDRIENAVNAANVLSYVDEFELRTGLYHSELNIELLAENDSAMVKVWIDKLRAIADAMEGAL